MELRHLRHFVAVAEELHFGRAAKRLRMAQPPLSQSIKRLEESLHTRLLERDSRQVRLTSAGAALLGEAREVLARADLAERTVHRVASGEVGRLRIGFVPMSTMHILPQAILRFHQRWPDVDVRLYERTSKAQSDSVRDGTLDAGIVIRHLTETAGLAVCELERCSYVAVVPAHWPMAKHKAIRLAGAVFALNRLGLGPDFIEPERTDHPNRFVADEAGNILPADQGNVIAEFALEKVDQPPPVNIFLFGHFGEYFG